MSFASDFARAIDAELDRLSPLHDLSTVEAEGLVHGDEQLSRLVHLQTLAKGLSISPSSRDPLATAAQVVNALKAGRLSSESKGDSHERDLEWFLIAKATNQAHALILGALVDHTLPLNHESWYWNSVVNSQRNANLYYLQTSPFRLWEWSKSVYGEVNRRGGALADGWQQFYGLVRTVIRDRSATDLRLRLESPYSIVQAEVRKKISTLESANQINASGIGYLLSNGFDDAKFQFGRLDGLFSIDIRKQRHRWKSVVIRSISVMDAILEAMYHQATKDDFEAEVTEQLKKDVHSDIDLSLDDISSATQSTRDVLSPSQASEKLQVILATRIPACIQVCESTLTDNARPPRLVRYWIPGVVFLLSGSTILRLLVTRRAEIVEWIRDLGSTSIDFFRNWIVEPTRKVIDTIRHDEESEISIVSKRSLDGDRESLERMVLDFVVDKNPEGLSLDESDIALMKTKIQEGDVTPVLKAYEADLKRPLYSSVFGNLIRTLLIQVQKEKVDIQVAMRGIDNLLKSQELVFGFIGLTPGLLVCVGLFRWLRNLPASQRHSQRAQRQTQTYSVLRNIDRILTASPQSEAGMLPFKDYGLLVCEAVVLRDIAKRTFPRQAYEDFLQEFGDLIDRSKGIAVQLRVADRIRWSYSKWL